MSHLSEVLFCVGAVVRPGRSDCFVCAVVTCADVLVLWGEGMCIWIIKFMLCE